MFKRKTYFKNTDLRTEPQLNLGEGYGHTMDVLSPLISALCHSDWLFRGESCACSLPLLRSNFLLSPSFLALTVSNSFLFTPALLRTHSFVFFAVHETRRTSQSPFISKASRRVSLFFLSVQLSQP